MKKPVSVVAIVIAAVFAVGFCVWMFKSFVQDPEPTVKDIPDYGKMTNEEIMKSKRNDLKMEGQRQPDPSTAPR